MFGLHVAFAWSDITKEMQELAKTYAAVVIEIKFIEKLSYYLKVKRI